jgi:plasmid maintenance system antidote protein VapI
MSPEFWINLQSQFDVAVARQRLGDKLDALPRKSA